MAAALCFHVFFHIFFFQGKLKGEAGKGWAETWDVNGNCSD